MSEDLQSPNFGNVQNSGIAMVSLIILSMSKQLCPRNSRFDTSTSSVHRKLNDRKNGSHPMMVPVSQL